MRGNFWIYTLHNSLVKAFHILRSEWGIQSHKFVKNASQGPYITFVIIRFVLPNFRTCIVWSTGLSFQNPCFCNFWDIQVSKFYHSVFVKKYVCALYISMNNFFLMQSLQPQDHLIKDRPNIFFFGESWWFLCIIDFGL